ncbi:MAG: copper resistance protein CopC [Corynebacterium nuruki]|jgi:methionine-rich copper-binding protein CopC|nr:copper resistance protein CopC [Corynebacterium nuruki]
MTSSRIRRMTMAPALAGALFAAGGVVGASSLLPAAVAHDGLVAATPGQDATVDSAPTTITLEFSGEPRPDFNTVALSRDGEVVASGTPDLDGRTLTLDIPSDVTLADGDYTVGYQITSSDGHPTRGSYNFTLAAGGTSTDGASGQGAATDSPAASADSDSGLPGWAKPLLGVAGVIVLIGVIVVLVTQLRRTRHDR